MENPEMYSDAIATGMMSFFMILLVLGILMIIATWKIYVKAGKEGWESIIPIYNTVVLFEIVGLSPWLVILTIIPFVNFIAAPVLMAIASFRLATAFNKEVGYGFGLWFLPFIFYPMLAFGDAQYGQPVAAPEMAPVMPTPMTTEPINPVIQVDSE